MTAAGRTSVGMVGRCWGQPAPDQHDVRPSLPMVGGGDLPSPSNVIMGSGKGVVNRHDVRLHGLWVSV